MTDIFIPKKEKVKIMIEATIYVVLIITASYFTIFGNVFIKMVPMLYFLGIFGVIMFNKPIVTVMLSTISIITFGIMVESGINMSIILFSIYAAFMIAFGELTGYIIDKLSENAKLRVFIKHYSKMAYIIGLAATILIPIFLNNLVNSNMITYLIARNKIDRYVMENYAYSEYYIESIKYNPSYERGEYEFHTIIDGTKVQLNYSLSKDISDVNMESRKKRLNKMINSEINIILKQNNLTYIDVVGRYDYSKIATNPNIIKMNISNITDSNIEDLVKFINIIKNWDKFSMIERIDVLIDDTIITINRNDLAQKEITAKYIRNGMKHEILDSKEDI